MRSLIEQFDTSLFYWGLAMALFKIPAMLRMSLRYVNTFKCLMVFYVLCLPCLQIEMYPLFGILGVLLPC